jgi:hypothetical protein
MHSPRGRSTCRAAATRLGQGTLRYATAIALATQIAVLPCVARADRPSASATELKARADAAMDQRAFASAILSYRSSYELSHSPALLYNIGSAYERLGDYPHALVYLERFASIAPPELKSRVPHLKELVESVRGRLARIIVHCSVPGARVLVRGEWQGTTPLQGDIMAVPGDAHVEIVADGYRPFVQELTLVPGKNARIGAVLAPDLATHAAPPPPRKREEPPAAPITSKWWFWTGVGVVIAGGTTAAVVLLSRQNSAPKGDPPPGQMAAPLLSW